MSTFPYTPSTSAVVFTYQGAPLALDIVNQSGLWRFGLIERPTPTLGQWIGPDANTSGSLVWELPSIQSPFPEGGSVYDPVTGQTYSGSAVDIINALTTALFTNYKGLINQKMAARFPSSGGGGTMVPPFVDDVPGNAQAYTWLTSQIKVFYAPPVNGQFQ